MTGAGGRLEPALLKCTTSAHPGVSARRRRISSSEKPTLTRLLYGQRHGEQLGVTRAPRRQLAAHERYAVHAEEAEVRRPREGVGERGLAARLTYAPERHVCRERARLGRKAEAATRDVHLLGERGHAARGILEPRPPHPRAPAQRGGGGGGGATPRRPRAAPSIAQGSTTAARSASVSSGTRVSST